MAEGEVVEDVEDLVEVVEGLVEVAEEEGVEAMIKDHQKGL